MLCVFTPRTAFPSPMIYLAGLWVFVREVISAQIFWQTCFLVPPLLLLCGYVVYRWQTNEGELPMPLNTSSISTIVPFVRRRYDFLNGGFQSTGETTFKFRLLEVGHVSSAFLTPLTWHSYRNELWWPLEKAVE